MPLAEAEIPYDQLKDMDSINPELPQADAAIVLGANDVVNPAASEEPSSPIYGMPILDVHKARTVIVVKRSLSPGFAGIPNSLFIRDNSLMVKGDAKDVLQATTRAMKELQSTSAGRSAPPPLFPLPRLACAGHPRLPP